MPKATIPLSAKGAATKPTGFTKPAGFGKVAEPEEEPARPSPVVLTFSIIALLVAGWFVFAQYQTDQLIGRMLNAQRVFGTPKADDASASSGDMSSDYASDDSSYDEESSDEGDSSSDEEASAEEEGDVSADEE